MTPTTEWRVSCVRTIGNIQECWQGRGPSFEAALADLIGEPIRPYEKMFVKNISRAHAAIPFGVNSVNQK